MQDFLFFDKMNCHNSFLFYEYFKNHVTPIGAVLIVSMIAVAAEPSTDVKPNCTVKVAVSPFSVKAFLTVATSGCFKSILRVAATLLPFSTSF